MTPKEAYDFLVRAGIINTNQRVLEGNEKEEMFLLLQFLDVDHTTNNQRFWTDHYLYGDKEYTVTFFTENDYEIVEILN